MEFADLTRGMRKKDFLEPEQLFFRKASVFFKLFGKQCFRPPSPPRYWFCADWKEYKHARRKQFFGTWKNVFLQSPVSSHKTIRGHATKKMNRKRELQTSRISSNLRIWQSYSRVPQILKVFCVWYSWKYVARLGFKPLKFLYSEFFLYNTQAVFWAMGCPWLSPVGSTVLSYAAGLARVGDPAPKCNMSIDLNQFNSLFI